jgi:hypothetical protein
MITVSMIEAGARGICALTGDDPDQKTYAREMMCTGRDREPLCRWEYWAPFAKAVLVATISMNSRDVPSTEEVSKKGQVLSESGTGQKPTTNVPCACLSVGGDPLGNCHDWAPDTSPVTPHQSGGGA